MRHRAEAPRPTAAGVVPAARVRPRVAVRAAQVHPKAAVLAEAVPAVRAAQVRPKAAVLAEAVPAVRAAQVRPKAAELEESEEPEVLREQNPGRDSEKKMTGVPTDHSWGRPEDQTLLLLYR